MPAVGYALLTCDAVVIDPNNGKANLFGVFERIWTNRMPPVIHSQLAIYLRCKLDRAGTLEVAIRNPQDGVIQSQRFEHGRDGEIPSDTPADFAAVWNVQALEFPVEGDYAVTASFEDSEFLRTPVGVWMRRTIVPRGADVG